MANKFENEGKFRLLYIYKILSSQTDEEHPLSTNQLIAALREQYGISSHRITVSDDIKILQQAGVEIGKIESTQNKYYMISRPLEPAELKVLTDAVASSKVVSKKKSRELMDRIASLGSPFRKDELVRNICPEERVKTNNESFLYNVDAVNEAINQKRRISFKYFNYGANKRRQLRNGGEPYVFSPYSLVWNGDYYYAVGWSDKHGTIVSFRVDRMYSVPEILDEPAVPMPKGFKVSDYIKKNYHMFRGQIQTVELLCDGGVMDSIIDRFGYDVGTRLVENGRFIATVDVAVNSVFFGWIFGFGGKVRIHAPEDVASEYAEMVKTAI